MHINTSFTGCILRPWQGGDKTNLVRNANNRKVWRNMTDIFRHPYTEADADRWFEITREAGRSLHLAIEVGGEAVGGIGAMAREGNACATAQFGYWLGESYWGLASATAQELTAHIESERLFVRLEATVFAWNAPSMRVLEKAGFLREGVLRKSVTKDGQIIDSVMYSYIIET